MRLRLTSKLVLIFAIVASFLVAGAQPSLADHSTGLQPDARPAPAPWVRQALNIDNLVGNSGILAGRGVKVAVLDSILQEDDPTRKFLESKGKLTYRDFLQGDWSDNQHGSSVLGLLADPVYGTSPESDFFYARACSDACSEWSISAAVRWAVRADVDIIVMAFGALSSSSLVEESLKYAQDNDILIVAAAGNLSCTDCPSLTFDQSPVPARSPHVLAVGALGYYNGTPEVAPFTAKGSYVDLAAPGLHVPSPGSAGVRTFGGTSAAAPIVAGVAAMLLEYDPNLTAPELAALLTQSASPVKGSSADQVGNGAINPSAAFELARNNTILENSPIEDFTKLPALPKVKSAVWTSSGLEVRLRNNYEGPAVLLDAEGAPVATTISQGRLLSFEYPLHGELVRWKGKWSVAASYGSKKSIFKPQKLPLPAPHIKSVATTESQADIAWHPVPKAKGYIVLAAGLRLYTQDLFISLQNLTTGFPSSIQVFATLGDESSPPSSPPSAIRYTRPGPAPAAAPSIVVSESGVVFQAEDPSINGIVEVVRSDGAWWEKPLEEGRALITSSEMGYEKSNSWEGKARIWQNVNGYYRPGLWSSVSKLRRGSPDYLTIDSKGNYMGSLMLRETDPELYDPSENPAATSEEDDTTALNPEYTPSQNLSFYFPGPWQSFGISDDGWQRVREDESRARSLQSD